MTPRERFLSVFRGAMPYRVPLTLFLSDQGHFLTRVYWGTTERTMSVGKPGGRFIMQNVDFLEYGTPLENLRAYVETALQYADY